MKIYSFCVVAILSSCVESAPQRSIALEVQALGADDAERELGIVLTRAELAVGAIYLCGNRLADAESCAHARGEWLAQSVVDLRASDTQGLGRVALAQTRGEIEILGAMMDLGIHWPRTQPTPDTDGPLRDENKVTSLLLDGELQQGTQRLSFRISVPVTASAGGTTALSGLAARHVVRSDSDVLRLEIDVREWLRTLASSWERQNNEMHCSSICLATLRAGVEAAPPRFVFRTGAP